VSERRERGREILDRLRPGAGDTPFPTDDLAPDFGRYTLEYVFGDLAARDGLTDREREIAIIAALTALGRPRRLQSHLQIAREVGLTKEEIVEVLLLMTAYAGFPAAHDALEVAMDVLD
jgi:4-carboxymuconolactone decarboxylase